MKLYKQELFELITTHKKNWQNILHSTYKKIYDDILLNTPELFVNGTISTKVFCYLHDIEEMPKCKVCGKDIFDLKASAIDGFKNTCSKKCSNIYKHLKTVEAVQNKYGVSNVYSLRSVIDKTARTKYEKYGLSSYNNVNKAQQTCIELYGVRNPGQSDVVKDKMKRTCNERYGVDYSFQAESVKSQIKQTSLARYGVENPGCSQKAIDKMTKTFQTRYGNDITTVGDTLKIKEIRDKKTQTNLNKYGCDIASKSDIVKQHCRDNAFKKYGCSSYQTYVAYKLLLNNEYDIPLFSLSEFEQNIRKNELQFKCKKCGNVFSSIHRDGAHKKCPNCFPTSIYAGHSISELDVLDFVKQTVQCQIIHSDRHILKPYEIDIYIPDKKIGIEYDGLFYHQFGNKPMDYHAYKTNKCEQQGIQLIHIFESDWELKPNIVKSRLKSIFGIYDNVTYARKCVICEITDHKLSMDFQIENHLQGYAKSSIDIGLFYEGQLVSLMTFGKTRFSKKYEYELIRFCNRLNWQVIGGASRLLKYFERKFQPKSLVSYADRRWSIGTMYEKLGFTLDHISPPNYWYFKQGFQLHSRIEFQKHKLKKILDVFDENKTEIENMVDNGYKLIYDSGNRVYVKKYS